MNKCGITADELLSGGRFGTERENLRVTGDGRLSAMPDPFSGEKHITRDFSENQAELNTPPAESAGEAYSLLERYTRKMNRVLLSSERPEYLWPFSNPPHMESDDELIPAVFEGSRAEETSYRKYLAGKYGRYIMAYSGIHVNYSLPDNVICRLCSDGLSSLRDVRDRLYLDMAAMASVCGWIVTLLTAASPVADPSFSEAVGLGFNDFAERSSMRCSDAGYWNTFDPVTDYTDMASYARSLNRYIRDGSVYRASELYIPVRIKPQGAYSPENLLFHGADHLEFRMIDLNPFEPCGLAYDDLEFLHLFFVWCCFQQDYEYGGTAVQHAADNYRTAAVYDCDGLDIVMPDGRVTDCHSAGNEILDSVENFYEGNAEALAVVLSVRERFDFPEKRYAARVLERFGDCYCSAGTVLAVKYGSEYV